MGRPGHVYLIHESDRHKIGVSRDPDSRLSQVAPSGSLVHLIASLRPFALERALHRRFARRALGGEWFALTPEDVALVRSLSRVDDVRGLPAEFRLPPVPDAVLSVRVPLGLCRLVEHVAGGLGVGAGELVVILLRNHLAEYRALADEAVRARSR